MDSLFRTLVLALLFVSLPLQGVMAATMPFCSHMAKAAQMQSERAHHDAQLEARHEHGKDTTSTGLACDDCELCQVCASPAVAGPVVTATLALAESPEPHQAIRFSIFYPELFQRPPLALAS